MSDVETASSEGGAAGLPSKSIGLSLRRPAKAPAALGGPGSGPPDTVLAWKDPAYRRRLTDDERSDLPDHPAGESWVDVDLEELEDVTGGNRPVAGRISNGTASCGHICTATTECPIASLCCPR